MNIFISNLSFQVQDEDLRQIFAEYGEVSSAKVITDKFSGRSRGFGFVEMPDDEIAQKAIDELNGVDFDGKVISVSISKPRTDNRSNNGGNRGSGNNSNNFRSRY